MNSFGIQLSQASCKKLLLFSFTSLLHQHPQNPVKLPHQPTADDDVIPHPTQKHTSLLICVCKTSFTCNLHGSCTLRKGLQLLQQSQQHTAWTVQQSA